MDVSALRGHFVDLTQQTTVYHQSDINGAASIWDGIEHGASVTVCPTDDDEDAVMLGISEGNCMSTSKMTREDALWLGRKLVDLANR